MKSTFFALCFILFALAIFSQNIEIDEVLVENRMDPIGIDAAQPLFTWKLSSDKRNVKQTAYGIQVGNDITSLENGRNLIWESQVSYIQAKKTSK